MQPATLTLTALAGCPLWVGCRPETRNGQSTKVPFNVKNGTHAKCDDPSVTSTWRQPSNGANIMNRLATPLRWYW